MLKYGHVIMYYSQWFVYFITEFITWASECPNIISQMLPWETVIVRIVFVKISVSFGRLTPCGDWKDSQW